MYFFIINKGARFARPFCQPCFATFPVLQILPKIGPLEFVHGIGLVQYHIRLEINSKRRLLPILRALQRGGGGFFHPKHHKTTVERHGRGSVFC